MASQEWLGSEAQISRRPSCRRRNLLGGMMKKFIDGTYLVLQCSDDEDCRRLHYISTSNLEEDGKPKLCWMIIQDWLPFNARSKQLDCSEKEVVGGLVSCYQILECRSKLFNLFEEQKTRTVIFTSINSRRAIVLNGDRRFCRAWLFFTKTERTIKLWRGNMFQNNGFVQDVAVPQKF